MKCFICGNISETMVIKDKILAQSFRTNIKYFCSEMYEDFVKANQPDVCVNCHRVVQQSANFKKMVLKTIKIITKTWFEYNQNKIDLLEIFGNLDPAETHLNHVYDIKDESRSQSEPMESAPNSPQGSLSENVKDLESIFCNKDPATMERMHYYKEQEQTKQKIIEDTENSPNTPKKLPAARQQRIPSVSKAMFNGQPKKKRWMICALCNAVLLDAQLLKQHIIIHAK